MFLRSKLSLSLRSSSGTWSMAMTLGLVAAVGCGSSSDGGGGGRDLTPTVISSDLLSTSPDFAPTSTPDLSAPDLSAPDLSTPDLSTPDLSVPDLSVPDLATPDLSVRDQSTPDLSTPDLSTPDLSIRDLSTPDLSTRDLTPPPDLARSPLFERVFEATSYSAATEPVFEITGGQVKPFATVNAGGWVGPLLITDDGHFWVATNALGGSIFDIRAGGDFTAATPPYSNLFGASLSFIEGMAIDDAGNFYLSNSETGSTQLVRVTPSGSVSMLPTMLKNPTGLLIVGRTLYISEAGAGRILTRDLGTGNETVLATGFAPLGSHVSGSLAADRFGRILVLWAHSQGVGIYDVTVGGDFTSKKPLALYGGSLDVNQIATNAAGDVFIAGAGSGQGWVCRRSGNTLADAVPFAGGLGDTETIAVGH